MGQNSYRLMPKENTSPRSDIKLRFARAPFDKAKRTILGNVIQNDKERKKSNSLWSYELGVLKESTETYVKIYRFIDKSFLINFVNRCSMRCGKLSRCGSQQQTCLWTTLHHPHHILRSNLNTYTRTYAVQLYALSRNSNKQWRYFDALTPQYFAHRGSRQGVPSATKFLSTFSPLIFAIERGWDPRAIR